VERLQGAGLIDDIPTCRQLIRRITAHLVIMLVVRHMRLPLLRRSGYIDYRNASASQSTIFCHIVAVPSTGKLLN
jgi:hypothetical protein